MQESIHGRLLHIKKNIYIYKLEACKVPNNKPWYNKSNLPHDAGVESVSGLERKGTMFCGQPLIMTSNYTSTPCKRYFLKNKFVKVVQPCLPISRRRRQFQMHSEREWSGSRTKQSLAAWTRSAHLMVLQPNHPQLLNASQLRRGLTDLWRAPVWCRRLTEAARSNCPVRT